MQMHTCVSFFSDAKVHTSHSSPPSPRRGAPRPRGRVPLAQACVNTVCLIFFTVDFSRVQNHPGDRESSDATSLGCRENKLLFLAVSGIKSVCLKVTLHVLRGKPSLAVSIQAL